MDDKLSGAINNICTILGGALLLYPLIDEATKTLGPEIKKITSGEYGKMLESGDDGEKHDYEAEVADLKRKLAEYEDVQKAESVT